MTGKRPTWWLAWYIRTVGGAGLLAFIAAIMPESWIVRTTRGLYLDPFPETPLAFYLARHLSLMYGFVGVALLFVSYNMPRFRDLIGWLAIGLVAFGALQGVIDAQAGLPIWWTLGESISTVCGGAVMYWLHRRCETESGADDRSNREAPND